MMLRTQKQCNTTMSYFHIIKTIYIWYRCVTSLQNKEVH